jgi:hypothetical protein
MGVCACVRARRQPHSFFDSSSVDAALPGAATPKTNLPTVAPNDERRTAVASSCAADLRSYRFTPNTTSARARAPAVRGAARALQTGPLVPGVLDTGTAAGGGGRGRSHR